MTRQMRAAALKAKARSEGGTRGEQQQLDALLVLESSCDSDEEAQEEVYCFMAPAPTQPLTMEEALNGPDRDKWLVTRDAEYNSQMENGTWELVPLPSGKKAIDCGWIPRIKTDNKGAVSVYKTRLVARGYQHIEKEDYKETFAATAKPPTVRVLLAGAAVCGWVIVQMDITTAFLYGLIDVEVFMSQPPGYEDGTGRVCQVKKAIYGLKQAPRCWYKKLSSVLEETGFRASACDESLFLMGEKEALVMFLVYVDDILLFGSSKQEVMKVQQKLMQNFKCKTLGEANYYLGMHIERDISNGWAKLHQEKYIKDMGQKYEIEVGRKVATPLPSEFKHVKAGENKGVDQREQAQFQSVVGSFLYTAVHTMPDISFGVGQLARVVQNPTQEQVDAADRIIQYLNSYPTVGVQYSDVAQRKHKGAEVLKEKGEHLGERELFLAVFADSSWASEKKDMSSSARPWGRQITTWVCTSRGISAMGG
ncbi:unnamed protein product [Closterium sp. NIES-53]